MPLCLVVNHVHTAEMRNACTSLWLETPLLSRYAGRLFLSFSSTLFVGGWGKAGGTWWRVVDGTLDPLARGALSHDPGKMVILVFV